MKMASASCRGGPQFFDEQGPEARGQATAFCFRMCPGSIKVEQVVDFLGHLLRHLPDKLLVVWDGLPAHRSELVQAFVAQQQGRLWLERQSTSAPAAKNRATPGQFGQFHAAKFALKPLGLAATHKQPSACDVTTAMLYP
jgi:hypothetical protein